MNKPKFRLRKAKIEELKEGKTIAYLAEKVGKSRQYLSPVFNGILSIDENLAKHILETLGKESVNISNLIQQKGIDATLFIFFEKD